MTEESTRSFDLVERPWIMVHRLDGAVEEVSLRDVFARAHEFRAVLGDIPTQEFALVRLLLAILHRAVDGPPTEQAWQVLRRDGAPPAGDVADYLGHFRHRFDLLHPETPFYQIAELHTARNDVFSLDRLIADVPTNARLFTTRLQSGLERITFAEAARWLVHCHAFDPSGIKSGAVGDSRMKGGRGYPIGTGWAGMLGGVLVEGGNLWETLLLQLIPEDAGLVGSGADDVPVWEREPHGPAEEVEGGRPPRGPLDLYTWQSRRVRLFSDADGVYGVLIANGDKLTPQDEFRREPMSAWRRSQAQEKKLGRTPVYMPREHEPERAFWRGLAALLPETGTGQQRAEGAGHLRPAVLDWLDRLRSRKLVPRDFRVHTRAVGMKYGSQSATTVEVVDDAVTMSATLLAEVGRALGAAAVDAVADAEDAAQELGKLAANLAEAAGGEGAGARDRAREMAYAALDRPFREWLAGLGPDSDPTAERTRWQRLVRGRVRAMGEELVTQAGPAAWRGREVRGRHVSTPQADLWFRRQLRRRLELAYQEEGSEVPA